MGNERPRGAGGQRRYVSVRDLQCTACMRCENWNGGVSVIFHFCWWGIIINRRSVRFGPRCLFIVWLIRMLSCFWCGPGTYGLCGPTILMRWWKWKCFGLRTRRVLRGWVKRQIEHCATLKFTYCFDNAMANVINDMFPKEFKKRKKIEWERRRGRKTLHWRNLCRSRFERTWQWNRVVMKCANWVQPWQLTRKFSDIGGDQKLDSEFESLQFQFKFVT